MADEERPTTFQVRDDLLKLIEEHGLPGTETCDAIEGEAMIGIAYPGGHEFFVSVEDA